VNRSLPIEHVIHANMERRVVSLRRKAGRRVVSVAPRVISGQLDFLGKLGSTLAGIVLFQSLRSRELDFVPART